MLRLLLLLDFVLALKTFLNPYKLIPENERLLIKTKANGTVHYFCDSQLQQYVSEYSLAELYHNQQLVGYHFFSLNGVSAGQHTFEHVDGSVIKAKPLEFFERKTDLGWMKMGKVSGIGYGFFQDVGHVLRVNTLKGVLSDSCTPGQSRTISYQSDYWFYSPL
jgi:hypothetical protein